MKVYLATAPWSFSDVAPEHLVDSSGWLGKLAGIGPRTVKGVSPPMGLLYLASSLREVGCEPKLGDGSELTLGAMLRDIEAFEPQLIGLSVMTPLWPKTIRLAREIKDRYDIPIVVGGPFPTSWRDRCLVDCDAVDYVIAGEGELIVRDLVASLRGEKPIAEVAGIGWRAPEGPRMNAKAPVPMDLDALPFPARDLVDVQRYVPTLVRYKRLPTTQFFSTRGCPFGCKFCWVNPKFRKRSIPNVMAEIDECIERYGIRDITFFDDDATIDIGHTEAIADALIEGGYDITWAINARVDAVDRGWTPELLSKLARAGVWRVLYGIESGVQNSLDTMRKKTKVAQIREAITRTRKAGIAAYGTFIFGTPGETFEEGLETIDFACSLGLDFASFTAMTPFPGTYFYDQIEKERFYGWEQFTGDKPSFEPVQMTRDQLQTLMKLAYRKFYFRPSYMMRRVMSCTSVEELRRNIAGFEGLRKINVDDEPRKIYENPDRAGAIGCGTMEPDDVPAGANASA